MTHTTILTKLSSLLRNPQQWPSNFVWDYTRPNSCAEAICRRLSNQSGRIVDDKTRGKIFIFADRYHPARPKFSEVTPEHVADLIDLHLRGAL